MNSEIKKRFSKGLVYQWPLYLLLPVICGLSVAYLFRIAHQPAAYEKLNVFVATPSLKSQPFADKIENEFKDKGLKEVTTTQSDPSSYYFSQKLSVVGYGGADLFLLPTSVLKGIDCESSLLPFSPDFKEEHALGAAPQYYEQDGTSYGLLIKEKDGASWLTSYLTCLDEDYFLCLNVTSKNIGTYGLYDNASYDLALETFDYFQEATA